MFPLCPAYYIIQIQECAHVTSVPSILYNANIRLCQCTLSAQHVTSFQYKNVPMCPMCPAYYTMIIYDCAHVPSVPNIKVDSNKGISFR